MHGVLQMNVRGILTIILERTRPAERDLVNDLASFIVKPSAPGAAAEVPAWSPRKKLCMTGSAAVRSLGRATERHRHIRTEPTPGLAPLIQRQVHGFIRLQRGMQDGCRLNGGTGVRQLRHVTPWLKMTLQ